MALLERVEEARVKRQFANVVRLRGAAVLC